MSLSSDKTAAGTMVAVVERWKLGLVALPGGDKVAVGDDAPT